MLSAVPLTGARGGQALVVSTALRMAAPAEAALRQHLRLVSADGVVLDSAGADVSADSGVRDLLGRAASAAAGGSGVLTGTSSAGAQPMAPVVAYAPVSTGAVDGDLGLAVVTATWLPVDTAPARRPGLIPAAVLLVLAVAGTLLLRRGLVTPIRRLRADALAVASGELAEPVRPIATTKVAEVRRTAEALERCRRRLRGDYPAHAASTGRSVPARLLVGALTVALLGWSAAVLGTLGQQRTQVPAALVAEQGLRLDRSADALRSGITGSLAELRAAAQLTAGKPPDQLKPVVDQLATDPAFRSVYVTDAAGAVQLRGGRAPLRDGPLPAGATPDGLHQHNTSGRVPVVYAYAGLSGGRMLIGEFDITRLAGPLQPAGERVRVVDNGDRTIADTQGYLAFDQLSDSTLRTATAAARGGQAPDQVTDTTLIAARGVAKTGAAAALNWVVVAEQPVSALGVADNTVREGARVAALITAVLALLLCGWHELVVVRPLRRVADAAERVASGESGEVVYPQRQDEIGTVASCLEICRQALADGPGRLGAVRRPPTAQPQTPVPQDWTRQLAPLAGNRS
jgi:methyl-accepting chemotaxis protein